MAGEGTEDFHEFPFSSLTFIKHSSFEKVGFGPFLVEIKELLDEILATVSPTRSLHVRGCKGAG